MRSSLYRVFFACAAVAGGNRVAEESEEFLGVEELLRDEMEDMIVKVQKAGIKAVGNHSVPDRGQLTMLMLTRQCVQEQAENYPSLMAKHGYSGAYMEDSNQLLNDVISFWAIRDLRRNHLSSFNALTGAVARMRDSTVLTFTAQLRNITNSFHEVGFNYEGAESRCAEDGPSQQRTCIVERASQFSARFVQHGLPALVPIRRELPTLVSTLIELRDLQVHTPAGFETGSTSEFGRLAETITAAGFDLSAAETECKAITEQTTADLVEHIRQQLQSPGPSISDCNEDVDGTFCPEGTALTVSRPSETVRGMSAFSTTYFAAWPVLNFAAPILTTLMGFGPTVGLMIANGPFPHGAIFGSIAYALFSTGARTCMCFPQECYYDDSTSSCSVRTGTNMAASNNPFSQALPFMSSKCVPSWHKEGACEMQACGEEDFSRSLGNFEGAPLFGTLGEHPSQGSNRGLYNCLSDSGTSADTLLVKTSLPGGSPNVPENRNKIFEQFL